MVIGHKHYMIPITHFSVGFCGILSPGLLQSQEGYSVDLRGISKVNPSNRALPLEGIPRTIGHHQISHLKIMKAKIFMVNWKKTRRKSFLTPNVNHMTDDCQQFSSLCTSIDAGHISIYAQSQSCTMPRESCVTEAEAIEAVIKYIDYFRTNQFPKRTSKIWEEMSAKCCDGKWTPLSWYTNVTNNRRKILSSARARKNVHVPPREPAPAIDETMNDSREQTYREETDSEVDENESKFELILTAEIWNQIKPIESQKSRTKYTLRPRVWTNIIADLFHEQYRIPCAFVFDYGDVHLSPDRKYFLKIVGRCSDTRCSNRFLGTADHGPCPITGQVTLIIKTRDTYHTIHAPVTRPCNGQKRKLVGKRALAEGSYNTRNNLARETTRRGETLAPIVPLLDVIRHAKQDFIREDLGSGKKTEKNPIHVVEELQFQKPYFGTITNVSSCPALVIYSTDEQIASYRQYCRINRQQSVVTIDSSGSMIRKLIRPMGLKSGHMFLFSIVINFSKTIPSVFQMISESQEWETIAQMLVTFVRRARLKPKRCISDNSKALLLAESIAFNGCTTSQYLEKLFISVLNNTLSPKTMQTFLFTDVAHFIHAASKWKIFQNLQLPAVRDFFVRALALMVDCQRLDDFKKLFYLTCVIALQSHEDSQLTTPLATTVQDARLQLQRFMEARPMDENGLVDFKAMQKLEDYDPEVTVEEEEQSPTVSSFIDGIIADARAITVEGHQLNAYYLPGLIKELRRVGQEFLLWTAVGNPFYMSHHTSSSSEANFSILKGKVFQQYRLPQRLDKFLMIHIRSLMGEQINFDSNLKHFLNQDKYVSSPAGKDHIPKTSNRTRKIIPEKQTKEKVHIQDNNSDLLIQRQKISSEEKLTEINDNSSDEELEKDGVKINDTSSDDECLSGENWRGKGEPFFFLKSNTNNDNKRLKDCTVRNDCGREKLNQMKGDGLVDKLHCGNAKNILSSGKNGYSDNISSKIECNDDADERQTAHIDDFGVIEEEITLNSMDVDSMTLTNNYPAFCSSQLSEWPSLKVNSHDFDTETVINATTATESNEIDSILLSKKDFDNVILDHDYTNTPLPKESSKMKKSHAKFFRDCPEIKYSDPKVKKTKLAPHLLPHCGSSQCGPVVINGKTYVLRNSCPFDSLVQIIYTAALDDKQYQSFLEQSTSPLAKFVMDFRDKGPSQEIYTQRAQLLLPLALPDANDKRLNSKFVSTINAHGNPASLWIRLMSEDPSVLRSIRCSNPKCGEKQRKLSTWCPQLPLTRKYGFSRLQNILQYYPQLWNVKCSCGDVKHEENVSNVHVFLELDCRASEKDPGETCKLYDMPTCLKFNQEYRLAGIIAYDVVSDHFSAYCLRRSGSWEYHNGLLNKVTPVRGNPKIQPECAIYIMNQDEM